MGVSCSPDIFQEKMSDLMQDLDFVRTYLDDLLIISSSTVEDHLQKLDPSVILKSNISDIGLVSQVYNQFPKRLKPFKIWYVQLQ
jgi:hypothetical protein